MQLGEFISGSILEIIEGVKGIQAKAEDANAFINPADDTHTSGYPAYAPSVHIPGRDHHRHYIQMVDFDVAVTVTEESQATVGGGLKAVIAVTGTKESGTSSERVSRIKISIPIALPLHVPESLSAKAARAASEQPPPAPVGRNS